MPLHRRVCFLAIQWIIWLIKRVVITSRFSRFSLLALSMTRLCEWIGKSERTLSQIWAQPQNTKFAISRHRHAVIQFGTCEMWSILLNLSKKSLDFDNKHSKWLCFGFTRQFEQDIAHLSAKESLTSCILDFNYTSKIDQYFNL